MTTKLQRKRFKICEVGTDRVVFDLEDLPHNHAQMMMLIPASEKLTVQDLAVNGRLTCRAGTRGYKGKEDHYKVEHYDVVRTQ